MLINFRGVIKGTVFAIAVTLVFIFILSLLSYFTNVGEDILKSGVYIAVATGILLGTIAVSRASSNKIFLNAMLVCILYLLLLILISFLINGDVGLNTNLLAIILGVFASGFLGYIIGK